MKGRVHALEDPGRHALGEYGLAQRSLISVSKRNQGKMRVKYTPFPAFSENYVGVWDH